MPKRRPQSIDMAWDLNQPRGDASRVPAAHHLLGKRSVPAQRSQLPVVISFTVETDGLLPDGSPLSAVILEVDEATDSGPAYYGVNCAHPTHFDDVLVPGSDWTRRIHMVRANASRMSHAELDEAADLDDGDPDEFGRESADLHKGFPHINVLGGGCGTDIRHIRAIAQATR
jgi:S-methylmethionine-dependent homocysteine/selenocysteine methylase